jgi:hypothetical protein
MMRLFNTTNSDKVETLFRKSRITTKVKKRKKTTATVENQCEKTTYKSTSQ